MAGVSYAIAIPIFAGHSSHVTKVPDPIEFMPEMPALTNTLNNLSRKTTLLSGSTALLGLAYLGWQAVSRVPPSGWQQVISALAVAVVVACLWYLWRHIHALHAAAHAQIERAWSDAETIYADRLQERIDTLNLEIDTRKALDQKLQRTLDDLYQQLASQRDFIAMVSHEFRTPISIIEGARQSLELLGTADHPQMAVRMERIQRGVQRMRQLVDGLQAADRLDRDSMTLELLPLSLASVVRRTLASLGSEREPALSIQADHLVDADASLLEIAIANLIGNAIKYGNGVEGTRVEVGIDGHTALVRVMDRGPGLSAADKTRVFERFYRGRNAQAKPGSGLGLYLAGRIAETHGGSVGVEDRDGGGSIFTLRLPTSTRIDTAAATPLPTTGFR